LKIIEIEFKTQKTTPKEAKAIVEEEERSCCGN
jgi:hypothetical protein